MTARGRATAAAAALAGALALSLGAARAQEQGRLRAGEHEGFSRIALDVPRLSKWEVEQDDRVLTVRFPDRSLSFDVAPIFPDRRISRVSAARAERDAAGTLLHFSLTCACEAEAYEFRPGMLVLDIRPEAPEFALPEPVSPAQVPSHAGSDAGGATQAQSRSETDATVDAARRRLLEQLTRAADQGLLDFREPSPAGQDAVAPGEAQAPGTAEDPAPGPHVPLDEEPVQVRARSVFDATPPATPEPRPRRCPEDDDLAPEHWRAPEDPYAALAEQRRRLVAEFDRPSSEAAIALARLQVALGFGVEARQTLAAFAPPSPLTKLLADLSHVVEAEAPPEEGPLARAADCAGRTALWRLAAGLPPAEGTLGDSAWTASMLDAFAELPVTMRRRLGPGLLDALIELGALQAAEAARLLLDRAPGDHGDGWRRAVGRLALARGDVEEGEALLRRVARSGGPDAAEAMLLLAETLLRRRDALPPALLDDLAAAAFSNQGTELGRRLLVAEILGKAGRRQLGAALQLIDTELAAGDGRRSDLEAALRRILETARAQEVGATAYAAAMLAHRDLIPEAPAFDPARARVAEELVASGLANAALGLIAPALPRGAPEARLAAARAEIALGRPAAARARLKAMPDAQAARLRARAFSAEGRYPEAWAEAAPHLPPDSPARAELAWRAGRWGEAAQALPKDDPRRLFALWMAGSEGGGAAAPEAVAAPFIAPLPLTSPPTLAGVRQALAQVRAARRRVDEALDGG